MMLIIDGDVLAYQACKPRYLKKENIPYKPKIFMHDEIQFSVPKEYSERAAQIAKEAFRDGPKIFGVNIMDGSAKIGNNWYDTL